MSDEILGYPNLEDVGVKPYKVAEKMPFEMRVSKAFGYFEPTSIHDDPVIPDPIPLNRIQERAIVAKSRVGLLESVGLN